MPTIEQLADQLRRLTGLSIDVLAPLGPEAHPFEEEILGLVVRCAEAAHRQGQRRVVFLWSQRDQLLITGLRSDLEDATHAPGLDAMGRFLVLVERVRAVLSLLEDGEDEAGQPAPAPLGRS